VIFDRFVRGRQQTSVRGGTGLGLAIVDRIAELHGGTVAVDSSAGGGSTFRLSIPQRREGEARV